MRWLWIKDKTGQEDYYSFMRRWESARQKLGQVSREQVLPIVLGLLQEGESARLEGDGLLYVDGPRWHFCGRYNPATKDI